MEPIRYRDDIEVPAPDEEATVRRIVERMGATQAQNAAHHRHAHRDAHAKSHAVVKGHLKVHEGLPAELAQGIFAEPRTYEVVARLSSAPGDIHTDEIPAPRGFALKVIGVDGERLSPELGGHNQDFLMVNFPTLAFGTVNKYEDMLDILEKNAGNPAAAQKAVAAAARGVEKLVTGLGRKPDATVQGLANDNSHMLGETYYTQAALRYGDHVAKMSIAPTGEVAELTGKDVGDEFDAMRTAVARHFMTKGASYEMRAQLCTDLNEMPVEDAAVLWDEETSPFRTVATLTFEAQDVYSPARRVAGDDELAFNPWNGVEAHRPLGSIMRVRKAAYDASSKRRHDMNVVERREPESLADIAD
ncbi:catalase family protein [Mobilicoccus pelagius]|uniref:Catalase n=1 Tax=Mobilicoccus pelagius NBRC 104925 TaxID=1089455 RepID=H5UT42_9MICO|nr:catalase family protein [Mobilicoccus pelagius]GAB48900.1 hypothetical protein MOPEL_084_00350 [Mobilicoccus pelagius NBRC 104925]